MIVKAYIDGILTDNRYKIRIPTIDKVEKSSLDSNNLSIANICSIMSNGLNLNLNDVVYVDFENDDRTKPIIIGCLSKNALGNNYVFDSFKVLEIAKLPKNTTIGDISYSELSCLIGSTSNLEEQIQSIDVNIEDISNYLDTIAINMSSINKFIENIDINKISSEIDDAENLIGEEQDKSFSTFFGKYNNLIEKSGKIESFIGTPTKTISSTIEELLSRLISLTDNTPIYSGGDSGVSQTIYDEENSNYAYSQDFNDIIASLRKKFPHGKYWNHSPIQGNLSYNGKNNQDGWTNTPCPKHGNCGTKEQTCNGYAPGNVELSWQCMGYADKCGYDVTGYDPRSSSMWKTTNNSSDLKTLKQGDIIRYKNDTHSIYVVSVKEDVVTYTDCNSDGHCMICWDSKINKSDIEKSFSYIRVSPTDLSNSRLLKR